MTTLVITDVQNDFMPGGALGVPDGEAIVPVINRIIPHFDHVVATLDWHPANHISFASVHDQPVGSLYQGGQLLWPDHCIQDTQGSDFSKGLDVKSVEAIFYKGTDPMVDSYSAFFDNARNRSTGLEAFLRQSGLTNLFFVGLATDYCVLSSVIDALDLGFNVTLIRDGCKAINLHADDEARAIELMQQKGAKILDSSQI